MKNIYLYFVGSLIIFLPTTIFAQEPVASSTATESEISEQTKSVLREIFKIPSEIKDYDNVVWKLFPTTNRWTFLKLNTRNGIIYQLQYDTTGNNQMETALNLSVLATGKDAVNGRFTLYPTENIWTFILLDQIDGRAYQVQWNQEEKYRMIQPIASISHALNLIE